MIGGVMREPATSLASEIFVVLVVDDDVLVRITVAEYLRDCGFHVIEAASGDEAITVLQSALKPIDLVFSDVQMPGANDGFALARWIHVHHPDTEVVLTSGYRQASEKAADLCHRHEFVPKPYGHAALLDRIRRLLGRHSTEALRH